MTDETAAGGKHSLRITELPGLEHGFEPYITYMIDREEGTLSIGLDLRCDEGGPLVYECRDDPYAYSLGPQLVVDADGWLAANGKRLLQLPRGEWASFWWGYQTYDDDGGFRVDGVRMGNFSWQWESDDFPGPFSPVVAIH